MKNNISSQANIKIEGLVKIIDLTSDRIIFEGHNDVNPEAMSYIIAQMLQGNNGQYIYQMCFGSGGTVIDETGNVTYKNVEENVNTGLVADLYAPIMVSPTLPFYKVVDENDTVNNSNPLKNNIEVVHLDGLPYTDIIIQCTLEEEEPAAFSGELIFDELGLKSRGVESIDKGYLLSHIVFDPVEKDIGRVIQVIYTLRVRF